MYIKKCVYFVETQKSCVCLKFVLKQNYINISLNIHLSKKCLVITLNGPFYNNVHYVTV